MIWIESVIERHAHSRIEFMVKAKSQFKRRSTANNVEIIIPVPNDADSPKFKTTIGHCKYTPETSSIIWTIKSFPGGKEYLMRAHFGLPSVESELMEGKPPIQVKFEIPYFTTSGIQVCTTYILTNPLSSFVLHYTVIFLSSGTVPENHRKVWLSGVALGQVHYAKW